MGVNFEKKNRLAKKQLKMNKIKSNENHVQVMTRSKSLETLSQPKSQNEPSHAKKENKIFQKKILFPEISSENKGETEST